MSRSELKFFVNTFIWETLYCYKMTRKVRLDLLHHENDLYQNRTSIMKQVGLDLLCHGLTCIIKHIGLDMLHHETDLCH